MSEHFDEPVKLQKTKWNYTLFSNSQRKCALSIQKNIFKYNIYKKEDLFIIHEILNIKTVVFNE